MAAIDAVVFDLGEVLVDWDPRHLYRKMFDDDRAIDVMLDELALVPWHREHHDTGARPMRESAAELAGEHAEYAYAVLAWADRHNEMISGDIAGTVELLGRLRGRYRLYALSNFAPEPVPYLYEVFPWMSWFDGVVISGHEGATKPSPELFAVLTDRYAIDPACAVFIDDLEHNVDAARALGFHTVHFRDPHQLEEALRHLELL